MAQNVVEKTAEYITESAHHAARATGKMADAIDDGAKVVRRVARQGSDAAEEFVDDTTKFLDDTTKFAQRNLWPTIVATLIAGVMIGRMMKRR